MTSVNEIGDSFDAFFVARRCLHRLGQVNRHQHWTPPRIGQASLEEVWGVSRAIAVGLVVHDSKGAQGICLSVCSYRPTAAG